MSRPVKCRFSDTAHSLASREAGCPLDHCSCGTHDVENAEHACPCPACARVAGHAPGCEEVAARHESGISAEQDDDDDRQEKPITVLELALHRGAVQVGDSVSAAEIERVGLPFMGGCASCGATIAAYNAAPSKSGFLKCADSCIGDDGWTTVEDAAAALSEGSGDAA